MRILFILAKKLSLFCQNIAFPFFLHESFCWNQKIVFFPWGRSVCYVTNALDKGWANVSLSTVLGPPLEYRMTAVHPQKEVSPNENMGMICSP
jgi:hypothetical protein